LAPSGQSSAPDSLDIVTASDIVLFATTAADALLRTIEFPGTVTIDDAADIRLAARNYLAGCSIDSAAVRTAPVVLHRPSITLCSIV
jgi:hypothetical protein